MNNFIILLLFLKFNNFFHEYLYLVKMDTVHI